MDDRDVVIVGAGLAGLACAHHLSEAGLECLLLEASDGVGGRVRTDDVRGFRLDRGFQVLFTAYPEARRVLDLDALDLHPFAPGAAVVLDGALHKVADPGRRPITALRSLGNPVGSLLDKLRVLKLVRRARHGEPFRGRDTTVLEALREVGFSERIVDPFFRPFLGGITLDRELAGSSHVLDFVIRMMAAGDIALPAGGMEAIPAQLAGRLPQGAVRLESPVAEISERHVTLRDGVTLDTPPVLVVATDGPTAARLLGRAVSDPGSKAVTCLYFAAPEPPVEGPWLVLNGESAEGVQNLAVLDGVAPGYAPAGSHLVSATLLGDPGLQEQELVQRVRRQLAGWFGSAVDAWEPLRTYTLHHAQPAQPPGYLASRPDGPRIRPGVYAAGDWLHDASIQGALLTGRRAAEAVLADR